MGLRDQDAAVARDHETIAQMGARTLAAGARRETTGLPPAPDGRGRACRRRQARHGRSAVGARRGVVGLPPAPGALPSVPCPASADAAVARLCRSPGLTVRSCLPVSSSGDDSFLGFDCYVVFPSDDLFLGFDRHLVFFRGLSGDDFVVDRF